MRARSAATLDRTCVRKWASFATVRGMAIACAYCKGEHDLPVQVRQCWADNGEQEVPLADEIPHADPGDGVNFQPSDDAPPPQPSPPQVAARRQVSSPPRCFWLRAWCRRSRCGPSRARAQLSRRSLDQRPGALGRCRAGRRRRGRCSRTDRATRHAASRRRPTAAPDHRTCCRLRP